jgi:hypothetical protein
MQLFHHASLARVLLSSRSGHPALGGSTPNVAQCWLEVIAMTTPRIQAKITPWDDPDFVRAFERARDDVELSGCCPEGPEAAAEVQRRLREAGYSSASVVVNRTVREALEHHSHWIVTRDA